MQWLLLSVKIQKMISVWWFANKVIYHIDAERNPTGSIVGKLRIMKKGVTIKWRYQIIIAQQNYGALRIKKFLNLLKKQMEINGFLKRENC